MKAHTQRDLLSTPESQPFLTSYTLDAEFLTSSRPGVRMFSVVQLGGGVRLGGGLDSCFLPLLTQPLEVTGSGGTEG